MEYKKKIVYVDENKEFIKKEKRRHTLMIVLIISGLINVYLVSVLINSITFDSGKVPWKKMEKARQFMTFATKYYYKDIDQGDLVEGCIRGMTTVMDDPYTEYFTKSEWEKFKLESDGRFRGIGISMYMDSDRIVNVHEVMKNTPAERVGIIAGDKILKIDGNDVTSVLDMHDIASLISDSGDSVVIDILRPSTNENLRFVVDIEEIKRVIITSEVLDNNIGYISMKLFDEGVDKEFEDHLNKLKKKNIKGLIIDLRDNPGGSYLGVLNIADILIPKNKLVVYTENKYGKQEKEYSKGPGLDMPMVVLVNSNSASASEILAGALKHNGVASLVGNRTYGKGLVQTVQDFDDGSGLKITIARYFMPNGECIQDKGIEPDYKVDLSNKYLNNIVSQVPREDDTQLGEALRIMKDKIK